MNDFTATATASSVAVVFYLPDAGLKAGVRCGKMKAVRNQIKRS